MKTKIASAIVALALLGCTAAQAAGNNWLVTVGVGDVEPKSNNGALAGMNSSVGSDVEPIITGEWLFMPGWGLELLASAPWTHDISLSGLGKIGQTKQLPPTLSIQYHFLQDGVVSPFVGVGLNWTMFWDTKTMGALAGNRVDVANSWGGAVHAGLDFNLPSNWLIRVDARWINISSKVKLNGAKIGDVNVDPMVYGLTVGYRF